VDYGITSLALDFISQCLKNKEDGRDEVSSKQGGKGESNEMKVDAPNINLPRQEDPNPVESAKDKVVEITVATPTEPQEMMSNDKNEVKSMTNETSHTDHKKDLKNTEHKMHDNKKHEDKKCDINKKPEANRSHDYKKSEAKRSRDAKNPEVKKSRDEKKPEAKKNHGKKLEVKKCHDDKNPDAKKSHDEKKPESKTSHDMKSTRPKPALTLKPVSQLKESSLFGSLLENVEKSSLKKMKLISLGGDYNKNSKYSKTKKVKLKDDHAVNEAPGNGRSPPPLVPVANVSRKVSGILIVERGSVVTKRTVKWRDDEDLVQIEFFEVDASERVNVHKLKF
jgi:hypothetical protein